LRHKQCKRLKIYQLKKHVLLMQKLNNYAIILL